MPPSTTTTATSAARRKNDYVDPTTLMRIKNLPWRARTVVEGFYNGLHRSPYHGFSAEFSEYRAYSPGDDIRYLDWRLHARTDRYFIKRFEDETNRRCHLVVDCSRSMEYGSVGYSKQEYARTLAATLAQYLILQRDAVGLLTFDADILEFLPASVRVGQLHRICVGLSRSGSSHETVLEKPLDQLASWVPRRGLVILVSDLLSSVESLQTSLARLRARGHEVLVMAVLDPGELSLSLTAPTFLVDLESGRRIYVDPARAAHDYARRVHDHLAHVGRICGGLGVDFLQLTTDQPWETALTKLVVARARRGARQITLRSASRSTGPSDASGALP